MDELLRRLVKQNKQLAARMRLDEGIVERKNLLRPGSATEQVLRDYAHAVVDRLLGADDPVTLRADDFDIYISAATELDASIATYREPPAIFISRGLFDLAQTEDQFAAVLGHELTHYKIQQKLGRHYAGKVEEGLCDLNAARMLEKAGYQRDGMLQIAQRIGERYPEESHYFRIIADEHPTLTNRLRRLTELKYALDRDRGAQRGVDGAALPATLMPPPIKEAAASIDQKLLMERYFDAKGYAAMGPVEQIVFLHQCLEENERYHFSGSQKGIFQEKLKAIDFDGDDMAGWEAVDALGGFLFDARSRSADRQAAAYANGTRSNETHAYDYEKFYHLLYDTICAKRYTMEEAASGVPNRHWGARYEKHPEELYYGRPGALFRTQRRFVEATDAETALAEARTLQAQAAELKQAFPGHTHSYHPFYIGGVIQGRHLPWAEFPIPEEKEWNIKPNGKLPPVSWDQHIEWARTHPEIATALEMTGVADDPRLKEIVGPRERHSDRPSEIKPNHEHRYQTQRFIDRHLEIYIEKPPVLTFEQQQEILLARQQHMLTEVDWSLLEKDFWGFVDTYQDALKAPVVDYSDKAVSNPAPFVDAFLARLGAAVTRGTVPLLVMQEFFSLKENSRYDEQEGSKHIRLRELMRRQYRDAGNTSFNEPFIQPTHPYIQFIYASPVSWFDRRYRAQLHQKLAWIRDDCHPRSTIDQKPPLKDRLPIAAQDYLGLTLPMTVEALLDEYEHTMRAYGYDCSLHALASVTLMSDAVRDLPMPVDIKLLVRLNNFRAVTATLSDDGHATTRHLTAHILAQTEALSEQIAHATDLEALVETYCLLDANFDVKGVHSGAVRMGGYRVSLFDFNPDLRAECEARLLTLLEAEPSPKARRAAAMMLLNRQTKIALTEPVSDIDDGRGPDIYGFVDHGKLDYLAKISSPAFREQIVTLAVAELAATLGKDTGTSDYQARLARHTQELFANLPATTGFAVISRLGTAIEAQQAAAYYLRDQLADKGLAKAVSDPWRAVLGEVSLEYLKKNTQQYLRISLIEFLQKPLCEASLTEVMGRIHTQEGEFIFNTKPKNDERHSGFEEPETQMGYELERMREQAGFDFMRSRCSAMHREYWALPIEMRAIAMHDLLFPAYTPAEPNYPLYQDYAYHRLFPQSPIAAPHIEELLRNCDRSEDERARENRRTTSPLRWSSNPLAHFAAPVVEGSQELWGRAKKGMQAVSASSTVMLANARGAITRLEQFKQFAEIDLETNAISRDAVEAYIAQLDPQEGEMIVSALMAGKVPSAGKSSIGQTINQTLSAARAAGDKVRQAAAGHPDTPDDIRNELKAGRGGVIEGMLNREDSKTMVSPPLRWQIFEWLEREELIGPQAKTDLPPITHVGPLLGAGSYGVTVKVDRGGEQSTAITLLRPNVKGQAEREFDLMEKTCDRLVEKRPKLRPMRDMIAQAKISLATETDMEKARQQIELGHAIYDDLAITVDGERFTFQVAKLLGYGPGYKETEIVPGMHFNDLAADPATDPAHRERLATAIATAENLIRASGGPKDEDRHGGQQRIVGNRIGIFDLGGLSLTPTTDRQRTLLGTVMGEMAKAQASGKSGAMAFAQAVEKQLKRSTAAGRDEDRLYLASVQRALIAEHDFNQYVPPSRQQAVLGAVLQSPCMAPAMRDGVKQGLGIAYPLVAKTLAQAASGVVIEPSAQLAPQHGHHRVA